MFCELGETDDGLPVHRNFQCPEYNDCLSDAAFYDLDLLCCDCSLKDEKRSIVMEKLLDHFDPVTPILVKMIKGDEIVTSQGIYRKTHN